MSRLRHVRIPWMSSWMSQRPSQLPNARPSAVPSWKLSRSVTWTRVSFILPRLKPLHGRLGSSTRPRWAVWVVLLLNQLFLDDTRSFARSSCCLRLQPPSPRFVGWRASLATDGFGAILFPITVPVLFLRFCAPAVHLPPNGSANHGALRFLLQIAGSLHLIRGQHCDAVRSGQCILQRRRRQHAGADLLGYGWSSRAWPIV